MSVDAVDGGGCETWHRSLSRGYVEGLSGNRTFDPSTPRTGCLHRDLHHLDAASAQPAIRAFVDLLADGRYATAPARIVGASASACYAQ